MRNGWLDPENIETRVYEPDGRPAPARVPVPSDSGGFYSSGHSVSAAAAEIFTRPVERRVEDLPLVTPITIGLAALCIVAGVTIGGLIGFSPDKTASAATVANVAPKPAAAPASASAPTAPAKPIVAPKPIVTPVPPPAPPPSMLRVESNPAGATVMFVSEGAATLVGTTPIDTAIDPAREYDVLVTLANHTSRIEHVGPSTSHHLVVALGPAPH
jgi:hypothetical protein